MTRARVQTLLPSLNVSQKLAAIGDVVGTMRQDRSTAIAGTLGAGPALVPVTLTLQSDRAPARTFTFEIVKDQLFTPLLTFASIANTLQAYEREFGVATFLVRGTAQVRGHGARRHRRRLRRRLAGHRRRRVGVRPAVAAAAQRAPAGPDRRRRARHPVVRGAAHGEHRAGVARQREPRAGETVPVHVVTRSYRGEERTHTIPIRIPGRLVGHAVADRVGRHPPGVQRAARAAAAVDRATACRS